MHGRDAVVAIDKRNSGTIRINAVSQLTTTSYRVRQLLDYWYDSCEMVQNGSHRDVRNAAMFRSIERLHHALHQPEVVVQNGTDGTKQPMSLVESF